MVPSEQQRARFSRFCGLLIMLIATVVPSLALGSAWSEAKRTLGLGAGISPEYEGANEYVPIPYFVAQIRWGARYFVGTDGTGLRADVVGLRFIEAGPAISFRRARDRDIEDRVIARLPSVDASVEAGAFLAFNIPMPLTNNEKDALTLDGQFLHDVSDSHNGHTIRISLKYRGMVTDKLVLQAGPYATYGSHEFMDAYFSVSAAGAAASGLNSFRAKEGFKDAGVRAAGRYMFTEHWNLNASLSYRRFTGDAQDSPIIRERGSNGSWFGGFALGYTF